MTPDSSVLTIIAVLALVAGLAGVWLGLIAQTRIRRLKTVYTVLEGSDPRESFIDIVARKTEEVGLLRDEVERLSEMLNATRLDVAAAIRHVSVVRYDAFNEISGRLSFSAAMLDDAGDGLILTSIHGRTDTRSYIKGVKDGVSESPLSPEELQAVRYAMGQRV